MVELITFAAVMLAIGIVFGLLKWIIESRNKKDIEYLNREIFLYQSEGTARKYHITFAGPYSICGIFLDAKTKRSINNIPEKEICRRCLGLCNSGKHLSYDRP